MGISLDIWAQGLSELLQPHLVFVFGHSDRNTDRRTAWIVCNNGNCDHDAGYV